MLSFLSEKNQLAKSLIGTYYKDMYRMSSVETLAVQTHCKLSDTQMNKLARCFRYYLADLNVFASKHDTIAFKKAHLANEYKGFNACHAWNGTQADSVYSKGVSTY